MKELTRAILILLFLPAFFMECLAQMSVGESITINFKSGLLLTHRDEIPNSIRNKKPLGFDASYSFQTNGTKAWHQYWNNPNYGFSIGYYDLNEKNILGNVYYATYFFEKSIFNIADKHQFKYRIAPGLSYIDVLYNASSNPDNILVSLPVNFVMELSLFYQFRILKDLNLSTGLNLTHYSNGAFKFPNIGVNIPNVSIGLSYDFMKSGGQETDITSISPTLVFIPESEWQIIYAVSWRSAGEEYNDLDFAYCLTFGRVWKLQPRYSWVLEMDLMYNNAIRKLANDTEANRYRLGLAGGIQFELGQLAFLLQAGVYVYRPEKRVNKAIYQRMGFKYELSNDLFFNLMLKAHYARADLIEIGFGLRI